MSTDWHVHCVDCKSTHTFDDANHQSKLMLTLCKHADSIAALADLTSDPDAYDIELRTNWGRIDAQWFRDHLGHQLLPINEYGKLLNQCYRRAECSECSASHPCVLELDHDGPCKRGSS